MITLLREVFYCPPGYVGTRLVQQLHGRPIPFVFLLFSKLPLLVGTIQFRLWVPRLSYGLTAPVSEGSLPYELIEAWIVSTADIVKVDDRRTGVREQDCRKGADYLSDVCGHGPESICPTALSGHPATAW